MKMTKEQQILKLCHKKLNVFDVISLYKIFSKLSLGDISLIRLFLDNYYGIKDMPDDFYKMFFYTFKWGKDKELFAILLKNNIYELINYLKYDGNMSVELDSKINPTDYFKLSHKQINLITDCIKKLEVCNDDIFLKNVNLNNAKWVLRKKGLHNEREINSIAIKMYLTLGFDNSIYLLSGKFGILDYEIIYFLFNEVNVLEKNDKNIKIFQECLFSNKKDFNNIMRLMLSGEFNELFSNFDYFYNYIEVFINKIGNKMSKSKLELLLKERYLPGRVENPEVDNVVLDDMLSSYYKYDSDYDDEEIIDKNLSLYNEKLKKKTKTSIPKTDIHSYGDYTFEMIPLNDVRNLVMGYRAGNCFRINGDAFILFNNFLTSPHMRLLSISTDEYKDFGMVLLMRNGNILIAQGIETSNRAPECLLGEKLYMAVEYAVKEIMNNINNNEDDEIVASIIGLTNNNTIPYNHNYLPFIVNPILNSDNYFYNGVDSYQGLIALKDGKILNDVRLFVPNKFYDESKLKMYQRSANEYDYYNYMEIEKILISLRYAKFKSTSPDDMMIYYSDIAKRQEEYTICTKDWFITVFQDGTLDCFINSEDLEVINLYEYELNKVLKKVGNNARNIGTRKI